MTPEEQYGVCRNNHPWSPENTLYESSGKAGARRRRCRECRRQKRQLAQAEAKRSTLDAPGQSVRRTRGGITQLSSLGRANADFAKALENVTAHCKGRSPEFTDWDTDTPPSAAKARELCAPCPLLELCRDAALEREESWFVWGGLVFIDGKVVVE